MEVITIDSEAFQSLKEQLNRIEKLYRAFNYPK